MAFEPLKFGQPIDILTLNRFLTKAWRDNAGNDVIPFEAKFARMWHHDAKIINGGALDTVHIAPDITGVFPYHRHWFQSPYSINDQFEHYFTLDAGTYDFVVLGRPYTQVGIVSWAVDGTPIGTTDFYSIGSSSHGLRTIVGVNIPTSGAHTLTGTVSSKNPESSSYTVYLYKYCFREQ